MKVLLVNPIIRASEYPPTRFPLGLAYIASVLLDKGHEIETLDLNMNRLPEDEIKRRIKTSKFDAVGLTGMITEYQQIKYLSNLIKELRPDVKIILGGSGGTSVPELILKKTAVDIIIISEGIETIAEIADFLERGKDIKEIRGIYYKDDGGKIQITLPRAPIKDVDKILLPAREEFDFEKYIQPSNLRIFNNKIRTTNVIGSYGCPYRCTYCYHQLFGYDFRGRSPQNLVEELRMLYDDYKINGILFNDDEFVMDKARVHDICNEIKKEKLDILWGQNGRVNLMDDELLANMYSAGCRFSCYGIESGSQLILNEIKKGVRVEQAKEAVIKTWESGMLPHGYLIIGSFSETPETVQETVKFCHETSLIGQFSFMTPLPNTHLYQQARQMGRLKQSDEWLLERWGEWNEKLITNLSLIHDDELIRLKRWAEQKILFGNLAGNVWQHMKIIKMRNIMKEGFTLAKRWYTRSYEPAGSVPA